MARRFNDVSISFCIRRIDPPTPLFYFYFHYFSSLLLVCVCIVCVCAATVWRGAGGSAWSAGNTVLNRGLGCVCVCMGEMYVGEEGRRRGKRINIASNQLRQPLLGRGRCCNVSSIQRGNKIRRRRGRRRRRRRAEKEQREINGC